MIVPCMVTLYHIIKCMRTYLFVLVTILVGFSLLFMVEISKLLLMVLIVQLIILIVLIILVVLIVLNVSIILMALIVLIL